MGTTKNRILDLAEEAGKKAVAAATSQALPSSTRGLTAALEEPPHGTVMTDNPAAVAPPADTQPGQEAAGGNPAPVITEAQLAQDLAKHADGSIEPVDKLKRGNGGSAGAAAPDGGTHKLAESLGAPKGDALSRLAQSLGGTPSGGADPAPVSPGTRPVSSTGQRLPEVITTPSGPVVVPDQAGDPTAAAAPGGTRPAWVDGEFYDRWGRYIDEHYKPETPEQKAKREKREKREKLMAAIGDALSAMHQAYSYGRGVQPMAGTGGLSDRLQAKYDKMLAQRQANDAAYLNGWMQIHNARQAEAYRAEQAQLAQRREDRALAEQERKQAESAARVAAYQARAAGDYAKAFKLETEAEYLAAGYSLKEAKTQAEIALKEAQTRYADARAANVGKGGGSNGGGGGYVTVSYKGEDGSKVTQRVPASQAPAKKVTRKGSRSSGGGGQGGGVTRTDKSPNV